MAAIPTTASAQLFGNDNPFGQLKGTLEKIGEELNQEQNKRTPEATPDVKADVQTQPPPDHEFNVDRNVKGISSVANNKTEHGSFKALKEVNAADSDAKIKSILENYSPTFNQVTPQCVTEVKLYWKRLSHAKNDASNIDYRIRNEQKKGQPNQQVIDKLSAEKRAVFDKLKKVTSECNAPDRQAFANELFLVTLEAVSQSSKSIAEDVNWGTEKTQLSMEFPDSIRQELFFSAVGDYNANINSNACEVSQGNVFSWYLHVAHNSLKAGTKIQQLIAKLVSTGSPIKTSAHCEDVFIQGLNDTSAVVSETFQKNSSLIDRLIEPELKRVESEAAVTKQMQDEQLKLEAMLRQDEEARRAEDERVALEKRRKEELAEDEKRRLHIQKLVDGALSTDLPKWCVNGISEDKSYQEAVQNFNNRNFQVACNELVDIHERGDVRADYWLGKDMIFFRSFCIQLTKNLKIYNQIRASEMVENGLTDPVQGLQDHYLYGLIGARLIERAAQCGVADAQADLGRLYLNYEIDHFLPRNEKVAEIWLRKAEKNQSKYGTYLLGVMAQNELIKGSQWDYYIKAADLGHLYSMQIVGQKMYSGDANLPQDKKTALTYLRILADQTIDLKKQKWAKDFIQEYYVERVERQ